MRHVAVVLLAAVLAACEGPMGPEGPTGPQGPAGPQGAQGPQGESVAYESFEGAVTQTEMTTGTVDTGGVAPGVVCYISDDGTTWVTLDTDFADDTGCGVIQETATTYSGRALVPDGFVDSGWTVRIILFWLPA